jgi:hypothetical protein
MKILKGLLVAVLVLFVVLIAVAPIGPMPGIFMRGQAAAVPEQWPDTSKVHEIQLRVPGVVPRVVNIWVVEYAGDLYIVGAKRSGWVAMLGAGGPVKMRLGDSTYALTATPVSVGWEAVLNAYVEKYRPDYPDIIAGFPSIDEAKSTVTVFRLGPRSH